MMKINRLRSRVQRAETIVMRHGRSTYGCWQTIRHEWKACWTAPRIVLVGFGCGFFSAMTRPHTTLGKVSGQLNAMQRVVELIGSVTAIARALGFGKAD